MARPPVPAAPDFFPATLGSRERLSSIVAVVFAVGVFTVCGFVFAVTYGDPRWIVLGLPFTLLVFMLGRYAPSGYRLGPDGVRVERRAGPVVIAYRRIREADREARRLTGLSVFGSSGVFGYFGQFWNPRLGLYRLYVSNRAAVVWLATQDGWVGLSPDRPEEFVARLRSHLAPVR